MAEGWFGPGGYLKEGFSGQVINGYGGAVRWTNNSQGFRNDSDFLQTPPEGVFRILSLGDSFTAGYRVGQEDTYSYLLERWSTDSFLPTEVLISCIESPQRGLNYLQEYGYKWQPHMVLLGITLGNDIAQDYISLHPETTGFNNGLEKYDIPGNCLIQHNSIHKLAHSTAKLLRRLHFIRTVFPASVGIVAWYGNTKKPKMFDACSGLGMFIKNPPGVIEEAYTRHFRVLSEFSRFCKTRNIIFAVLIFPQRFQVQARDWTSTVRYYALKEDEFDILLPNRRIRQFCEQEGIFLIDPTESMKKQHQQTKSDFYLPQGDMHWNKHGHHAWFEGAKPSFAPLIRDSLLD
ncbi:MAG: hypothetical protein GY749_43115 [Desulfobacteraceae bacterium]|nr:hypothetical protein [Desulfobacteraceae bacterium]